MVSHELQIVGAGQTAGAAADDSHALVGCRLLFRQGHSVAGRIVDSHTLQAADVNRCVNHAATAACFTRMLADEAAGSRERIILADELNSVGITASANEGDVAGDVDLCRAQSHAGDRVMDIDRAFALFDVVDIILTEAFEACEHHFGSFEADSAVCAVSNVLRGAFDKVKSVHVGFAVQNILHKMLQLAEAYAAGHAFTAGLSMADLQERKLQINRAESRRAGNNVSLQVLIKTFDRKLGLVRCFDF